MSATQAELALRHSKTVTSSSSQMAARAESDARAPRSKRARQAPAPPQPPRSETHLTESVAELSVRRGRPSRIAESSSSEATERSTRRPTCRSARPSSRCFPLGARTMSLEHSGSRSTWPRRRSSRSRRRRPSDRSHLRNERNSKHVCGRGRERRAPRGREGEYRAPNSADVRAAVRSGLRRPSVRRSHARVSSDGSASCCASASSSSPTSRSTPSG